VAINSLFLEIAVGLGTDLNLPIRSLHPISPVHKQDVVFIAWEVRTTQAFLPCTVDMQARIWTLKSGHFVNHFAIYLGGQKSMIHQRLRFPIRSWEESSTRPNCTDPARKASISRVTSLNDAEDAS